MADSSRTQRGAYYTPPVLVTRLLAQATSAGVDWSEANVLDPSCGAGAILIQAALRMREANAHRSPGFIISDIAARLRGIEIDALAADLAQRSLEIVWTISFMRVGACFRR